MILRLIAHVSCVRRRVAIQPSRRPKVEISPVNVTDAGEIERDVADFARGANGGLIVASNELAAFDRDLIVMLAARHRLPAIYLSPVELVEVLGSRPSCRC